MSKSRFNVSRKKTCNPIKISGSPDLTLVPTAVDQAQFGVTKDKILDNLKVTTLLKVPVKSLKNGNAGDITFWNGGFYGYTGSKWVNFGAGGTGSQNLAQVLTQGNSAEGKNITNVGNLTANNLTSTVVSASTIIATAFTGTLYGSASKLYPGAQINGIIFDGTTAITIATGSGGGTVYASSLDGDTLAANVIYSSLETVGTLSGLNVNGSVNITATLTAPGVWVLLGSNILGANNVTLTVDNIPSGYKHLKCILYGRTNTTNNTIPLVLRFNNDSGATSYDRQAFAVYGTVGFAAYLTQEFIWLCEFPGIYDDFYQGILDMLIPNYTSTLVYKNLLANAGTVYLNGGEGRVESRLGTWRNTNPITRIDIFPADGVTQFLQYSGLEVYGLN